MKTSEPSPELSVFALSASVPSTGPATTDPLASTITTFVISLMSSPDPSEPSVTLKPIRPTLIASPLTSVVKAPRGWFEVLIAMFCAGATFEDVTLIVPAETVTTAPSYQGSSVLVKHDVPVVAPQEFVCGGVMPNP